MSWRKAQEWTQERWWKLQGHRSSPSEISWSLDDTMLSHTQIQAPSSYRWYPSKSWIDPIKMGFERFVEVTPSSSPPSSPPSAHSIDSDHNIEHFHFFYKGTSYLIAVDFDDKDTIQEEIAASSFLYFKMQHRREGYERFSNVVPGGYVVREDGLYSYLQRLRKEKATSPPLYQVYGRFGAQFASTVRKQALDTLHAQTCFSFEGSLKIIRYSHYLKETALANVCIDLPGNGAFCFRLIDYLAIGACVIGPRPTNRLHVPLHDRKHIVYCKDDFSDLIELCDYYLTHDDERNALIHHSQTFFDQYLHYEQLAAYYLHTFYERV